MGRRLGCDLKHILDGATQSMNRTSLLTFAAAAALAVAASTGAEAFCSPGHGARAYGFGPAYRVKVTKRPKVEQRYSRPTAATARTERSAGAGAPISLAKGPAVAAAATVARDDAAPISVGSGAASAPGPAAAGTDKCLRKEYLETGAVRFRDTCNNEWAINSSKVKTKLAAVGGACLTKDTNSSGIVTFRDVCTNEWAMNTLEQMSLYK
jgi:hypothetical protein